MLMLLVWGPHFKHHHPIVLPEQRKLNFIVIDCQLFWSPVNHTSCSNYLCMNLGLHLVLNSRKRQKDAVAVLDLSLKIAWAFTFVLLEISRYVRSLTTLRPSCLGKFKISTWRTHMKENGGTQPAERPKFPGWEPQLGSQ